MKGSKFLQVCCCAIVMMVAGSRLAAQSLMYVPLFETVNLKKDFQYVATRLLKSYIEDGNRYRVIIPPGGDTLSGSWQEFEVIQKKARELNAQYFTIGSLTRLGENVIVEIKMYETATGNKSWGGKLRAASPDDLDPILQKVAKAIGTPSPAALDGDIYSVTTYESKELKKKEANFSFGASVGGVVFINNIPGQKLAGFGIAGSYDTRQLLLDIRGNYYFSAEGSFYNFGLEVNKPLHETSNTAYFGGGMYISGTSVLTTERQTYSGLVVMAGGGYIFNRTSSVQLRLSANMVQSFYNVGSVSPTGVLLKMEISLKR